MGKGCENSRATQMKGVTILFKRNPNLDQQTDVCSEKGAQMMAGD